MIKASKVGAIIVAAGRSERIGGADKLFLPLGGKPLLAWSVDICGECNLIHQIVVVLSEGNLQLGQKLVKERSWSKAVVVCLGGKRRQDSVRQGLNKLKGCDWVMIHDGDRPFLTSDLIQRGLKAVVEAGATAAAVPVKETIKLSGEHMLVEETLPRSRLWVVQTPQIFRFDIIVKAYQQVDEEVTDDASLVEKLGYKVKLYAGGYDNVKVTTPEDLALAKIIAKDRGKDACWNRLRCSPTDFRA